MRNQIAKAEDAAHLEGQINAVKLDQWVTPEPLPLDELQRRYGRSITPPGIGRAIQRQAAHAKHLFGWSTNGNDDSIFEIFVS